MAAAKKKTARGRKQDRARVAGGQKYEVGYEAKKTGRSVSAVKKAVKKVGNSRKRVEKRLGRCVSAWNKDPVFGVIGIQSGPRDKGPQWLPSSHGSRGWDAGGGDDW